MSSPSTITICGGVSIESRHSTVTVQVSPTNATAHAPTRCVCRSGMALMCQSPGRVRCGFSRLIAGDLKCTTLTRMYSCKTHQRLDSIPPTACKYSRPVAPTSNEKVRLLRTYNRRWGAHASLAHSQLCPTEKVHRVTPECAAVVFPRRSDL